MLARMLRIVGGPMFAGKTTWLINTAKALPKERFRLFKPDIDNRFSETMVISHDGDGLTSENISSKNPVFPDMDKDVTTLLIDELNFFNPKTLIPAVKEQLELGKHVYGVGLLYDVNKKVFGATLALAQMADEFIELYANCNGCGVKASNTYRKVKSPKQILIGASDLYGAACDRCWPKLHVFN